MDSSRIKLKVYRCNSFDVESLILCHSTCFFIDNPVIIL